MNTFEKLNILAVASAMTVGAGCDSLECSLPGQKAVSSETAMLICKANPGASVDCITPSADAMSICEEVDPGTTIDCVTIDEDTDNAEGFFDKSFACSDGAIESKLTTAFHDGALYCVEGPVNMSCNDERIKNTLDCFDDESACDDL